MTEVNEINSLSSLQRIFLILSSLLLIVIVFLFRGGVNSQSQLDQLARNSLEPLQAISNGKPTMIEFYADWCEVCNEMAPNMIDLKKRYKNEIDIVLLNVDNSMWNDFIEKYDVQGIPHFNFFNKKGEFQATLIGLQEEKNIERSFDFLLQDQLLNKFEKFQNLDKNIQTKKTNIPSKNISPRSHG